MSQLPQATDDAESAERDGTDCRWPEVLREAAPVRGDSEMIGRLVGGKYRVVQRLGSGGVADVYEAVHEQIGQRAAIKVLKRDFMRIPEVADRFQTEARVAGTVGHPGIVQVFDYGHLPSGEPYLIMELLVEDDLYKVLLRVKRLEVQQAVGILLHVLDALDAAHRAGIVHRDLKPENVIITRGAGGEPWAKIIDFGIARVLSAAAAPPRQTAVGTVIGTPHYLSPEQARGRQDVDARTDIYSVGVMLFELLTGKLPFEGNSAREVIERVLTDPFPGPRAFCPSIPAELEQVILKATARRREDRYASAKEFMVALRPFKEESVTARVLVDDDPDRAGEISVLRRIRDLAALTPPSLQPAYAGGLRAPPGDDSPTSHPGDSSDTPPPTRLNLPGTAAGATENPDGTPARLASDGRSGRHPLWTWAVLVAVAVGVATLVGAVTSRSSATATAAAMSSDTVAPPSRAGSLLVPNDPPAPPSPVADVASRRHVLSTAQTPMDDAAAPPREAVSPADASADVGAPAPVAVNPDDRDAGSARRPLALVKLAGLPPGAEALVDGRAVAQIFPMEVSDDSHVLYVVGRGWKPFVREFRVRGELTIPVRLEPSGTAAPPPARDGGASRHRVRDVGPYRPLGNPFGES